MRDGREIVGGRLFWTWRPDGGKEKEEFSRAVRFLSMVSNW